MSTQRDDSRPRPRPYRRPAPDSARVAAFDLLRAVGERDAYANLVLPKLLRDRALSGRDSAFATELAYGTLRGRGTYDAVIQACVDRPLAAVDPPVLDLLRIGAHQLLAMRVPSHAAVSATVELARAVAGEGKSKFVNAVLRKLGAKDLATWVAQVAPQPADDRVGHLAVEHSHPRWIVSALCDALGGSLDDLATALAADNLPAAVSLVARPGRATVEELGALGALPGRWSPYAMTLPEGDPAAIEAVRSGAAAVQDEGSQLVAIAAAGASLSGRDTRWLDMCAGPGGKAALLGAIAKSRGARVVAGEVQPHRATLVRQAVGADADVVIADAQVPPWRPGTFDRVLLDAPCTGLGALRRRPDARWRRRPEDVPVLAALQRSLLAAALDVVRPGGLVAYATCSPHLAETVTVVDDVLRRRGGASRVDARAALPAAMPALGEGPDVQLWPHVHGTDAMYLALLRRDDEL